MTDASIPPNNRQRTAPQPSSPPASPPPEDDQPTPPPEFDPDTPPPPIEQPPFESAQNSDIAPPPPHSLPPPPPPPQDDAESDDEDVQDAAYWSRLAASSSSSAATPSLQPSNGKSKSKSALYLDTINRGVLDFDFEKLCSISLSNINVYACLVCGKYFQGRGRNSYAYLHSIDFSHHVFLHLGTAQAYILPENYEVPPENQAALQDIKYLLNPTFTRAMIEEGLDARPARGLGGVEYCPGSVGLNNVGRTDYVNSIVQALVHVRRVRDWFLKAKEREKGSELVRRFGALVRKMWNPRAFKAQVSPHEFLQQVAQLSGNRFKITEQADPVEFLGWLLNRLDADLSAGPGGKRKRGGKSIISESFQGLVQVEAQPLHRVEEPEPSSAAGVAAQVADEIPKSVNGQRNDAGEVQFDPALTIEKRETPFFLLAMDLPAPPPVIAEGDEESLVPQVTIAQVLSRYDGVSFHASGQKLMRYRILRLPQYLIIHFRRFTRNSLGQEERNPTLVNFPIRGLDVSKHIPIGPADDRKLDQVYDLVANVVYDAVPGTVREKAAWKTHVHTLCKNKDDQEKWFQIQDLLVEEVNRQMIFLGESYVQVWEKRQ